MEISMVPDLGQASQRKEIQLAQEREIGFGVVGLGMGKNHARAVDKAEGAKLIAVCDIDEKRLHPIAEAHGVKAYTSYDEMLKDDEIDVINVCTPSGMHVDMAIPAIEAGKNVIVEKPVDIVVAKIDKLIEAGKKAGVKMSGIFQSRTTPMNKRMKDAIDSGRLGKLIGVHGILPWYVGHGWRRLSHESGRAYGRPVAVACRASKGRYRSLWCLRARHRSRGQSSRLAEVRKRRYWYAFHNNVRVSGSVSDRCDPR